jgi:hypothetical protein
MSELSPIDERWMFRALLFIKRYVERHGGEGPLWSEIAAHMLWSPSSCSGYYRMRKLAKRGVTWDEDTARSTRLSPEGVAHLEQAIKAQRRRA